MFKKVLVANRGEIAVQIIRSLKEMGIKSVAAYSVADRDSLFASMADESICVGDSRPQNSYLNIPNIVNVAILTGCDAIHPGYGFLSESSEFARVCEECNLTFIGPDFKLIDLMGDKSNGRNTVKELGLPVVPGSEEVVSNLSEAKKIASELGYPVLLKAADGGGGKGIRIINDEAELEKLFLTVVKESISSFGRASIYLEKVIEDAKHIEFQVFGDNFGNYIYLPERDCSMQRNRQKVIEETPCSSLSDKERSDIGNMIVNVCKKLNYRNTGTFEFLMDRDHNFYFMEMNTRIQVEHTITEEITGLELIKLQILIASGKELPVSQEDIKINGHAMECRINAENPAEQFMPSSGHVKDLFFPDGTMGVRIDSGIRLGSFISPFYDSMIAKFIVKNKNRESTINRMRRIVSEFSISGVISNKDFLLDLLNDEAFNKYQFDTKFIENKLNNI